MTLRSISNVTATWTDSGTTYTGVGVNVYATSYSSTSRPFNVRVNGDSIFSVDTLGTMRGNTVNALFATANSAYDFANNLAVSTGNPVFAFRHANSAYITANAGYITTNAAYASINSNWIVTNAAYGAANASVKLVSATQTIWGEMNVSGNVVTTNGTSSISSKYIKANYFTPKDISFVSHGGYNTFFMLIDGSLYSCHGTQGSWNAWQAGRAEANGFQADWGFEGLRKVMFPYETTAKIIQADFCGCYCAYALFSNGNLYTWGNNNYGQLGLGDTTIRYTPTLAATGVTNVYSSAPTCQSGYTASRMYIKKTDGYIYGCGYNGYGALGLGDTTQRNSFTQLTALGTDVQYVWNMGADYGSAFAVKNSGAIYAAGYNGYGTLGNGTTTASSSWIDVSSYFNPTAVGVTKISGQWGNYNTIAVLLSNGDLYMCGYNGSYEIGNGNTTQLNTPVKILTGVTGVWSVGGGSGNATMFAAIGNTLYAWGYNGYGQTGNGGTSAVTTPTVVRSGNFSDFMNDGSIDNTTSYAHYATAIIRGTDGYLYATGWGGYGEMGNSYTTNTNAGWQRVLLPGDMYPVKVGSYCTTGTTRGYIAIGADNKMYAWGYNGQYGVHNNNIAQHITVPMQVFAHLGG